MLPLACHWPSMVGILVVCGTPLFCVCIEILLLRSPLSFCLKTPYWLGWNFLETTPQSWTLSSKFSFLPSFFPSGNSSNREHWQKLWELEERKDKGLSPSYFCFLWYLQQHLCLLHVSISLYIIYLFLLWPSSLLAAPTEPLTPSNYQCNQTISIGLGMDKY